MLAIAVGLTAGAVAGWASGSWVAGAVVAVGGAVVTLLASWVAGTLPGPPRTEADASRTD